MTASIRSLPIFITMQIARSSLAKLDWNDDGIPESWRKHYLDRMTDLIDKYQPDLLYTDGHLPFEEYGLKMVAHLYNVSAQLHGGETEAVYTSKEASDCAIGTCLLDHERGVSDGIAANPWQTDTCIGQWHYKRGQKYKTAEEGHRSADGHREQERQPAAQLSAAQLRRTGLRRDGGAGGITAWMQVNSEGIYSTRPWKIYGEGPSTRYQSSAGNFNEDKQSDLTAEDVRFTAKGSTVYAFVQGLAREGSGGGSAWPGQSAAARQDSEGGTARLQGRPELEAGRRSVEGADAGGEAFRYRHHAQG